MPVKKTVKKRAPLSREKVLAAALRMADADGLEELSMRNLAAALKVEAMSLYNHVDGKEDLLDALVDLVAGEIAVPVSGGDWKEALRERAWSAHRVLMKHSWATLLFTSRLNIGPNMLRYVDATISCLLSAGFSFQLADDAWTALDAFIYGFTLHQRNFPIEKGQYAAAAKSFLHMIPADRFPGMNAMSQEVIAGRHSGLHELSFGLEILLEGFERRRLLEQQR